MKLYPKGTKTTREEEAKKSFRYKGGLDVIHPGAAGLDLHKESIVACVPKREGEKEYPIREFGTYTQDLEELGEWLKERGVTSIAMEATGVFWWPVVDHLRSEGMEVLLVNAREVRSVKGRPKTDKADSRWLRRLHACGLLRGSFIPDAETSALKNLWRHRQSLEEESVRAVQRIQKALQIMNVRLDIAVSNVVGETGMRILEAILRGERDAEELAKLRDPRVKCSEAEMATALRGNYKEEQVFVIGENLNHYRYLQVRIEEAERYLRERMERMEKRVTVGAVAVEEKGNGAQPQNVPSREQLHELLGVDLTQIKGVGVTTIAAFLVTVGRDMSPWPTAKHFVSWLGLAPMVHESAGKKKSAHSAKNSSLLAQAFRMAAMVIGRLDTYLGAYYRRLKGRIGAAKAITATARKLAMLFYHAVRDGGEVVSFTAEWYEELYREKTLHNLQRKAARQGYQLVPIGVTTGGVVGATR